MLKCPKKIWAEIVHTLRHGVNYHNLRNIMLDLAERVLWKAITQPAAKAI